jgi:hypothetical protein
MENCWRDDDEMTRADLAIVILTARRGETQGRTLRDADSPIDAGPWRYRRAAVLRLSILLNWSEFFTVGVKENQTRIGRSEPSPPHDRPRLPFPP